MSILNFGSCCIDNVYSVPHFAQPGETLLSSNYEVHPGGKGLNQSIALAASGATVHHAGKVGEDGRWLIELLQSKNVATDLMTIDSGPSGHANIQVTPEGENSIVLFGGTNRSISHKDVDRVLGSGPYDYLLIQNEVSSLDYLIDQAATRGMKVAFNAAPMTDSVLELALDKIELLIVNEIEGAAIAGTKTPDDIIRVLLERYPKMKVLLTLGADGAQYADMATTITQSATPVEAIDTTGAGDTFTGFFLGAYSQGESVERCLTLATRAAGLCVTRRGAATSIPSLEELE